MSKEKINYQNYRRLFSYALKYKGRLAAGIIAGLLSAGSFFGLLSFMPDAFQAFSVAEGEEIAQTDAAPSALTKDDIAPVENARPATEAAAA